jgi:nitroreductase
MDPVLELLRSHSSVRDYLPEPVSPALVRECVAAAQQAATSSHVQAYGLLQVTDPGRRAALAEAAGGQAQVSEAGAFFVVHADLRRFRVMAEGLGRPFAPNLEAFLVAVIDAALFAQNLVVALEARGLGTCYIGGLRNDLDRVREVLEVPLGVLPLFGLCAGTPASRPAPKPRLAPEAVLAVDRYPDDDEVRRQIAEHDARMAEYYAGRGLPGRNWSGGVHRKFVAPARTRLASFYAEQGASLD